MVTIVRAIANGIALIYFEQNRVVMKTRRIDYRKLREQCKISTIKGKKIFECLSFYLYTQDAKLTYQKTEFIPMVYPRDTNALWLSFQQRFT